MPRNQVEYNRKYRLTHLEQVREAKRKWRLNNLTRLRKAEHERSIKSRYGLTKDAYESMLLQQDGACAICREPFIKRPSVDHDHATNRVRGLLCGPCNHWLIGFEKSVEWQVAARAYLGEG